MRNQIIVSVSVFIQIVIFALTPTFAQNDSTFAIRMNGHKHNMEEDLFKRALQEQYDVVKDEVDLAGLLYSLAQDFGITITDFTFPNEVNIAYMVDGTGVNDFMSEISLDNLTFLAQGLGCNFDAQISNFGLKIGGVSEFNYGEFLIDLSEPDFLQPTVSVTGSGGFLCPTFASFLEVALLEVMNQYINDLSASFDSLNYGEPLVLFSLNDFLGINDPQLISAAYESFPMNGALFTENDFNQGIVQLIVEINFLTGTTYDSLAFVGIEPDAITGSQLETGGFSYLYWALQKGFPWHTNWDELQRVEAAFNIMDNLDLNGYRVEIRWSDLQAKAYLGNDLDPADITAAMIDSILLDSQYWDTTAFSNIQSILDNGSSRGFTPFLNFGTGHQDRMPVNENGMRIAPATDNWIAPAGYVGVSANEYLYNLKIYALATVRRFSNHVTVWQAENELNAAGWAAALPEWWRKGDLWLDEGFRDQVWDILVDAIRTEDPTGLITHDLHMLGFMHSLESWIDDLDIIGFNFYPNQVSALPVLGFSVGEYVWAVRRALKGLNYPDKPVWLIETGYPGIEIDDPADSLSLPEDIIYFSENRQKEYLESALSSSVKNGARGFFYYSLTAREDTISGGSDLSQFMRFSGLIRRDSDEEKAALQPYSVLYNQLVIPPSSVNENEIFVKSFIVKQNYPNPFNPSTTIEFTLPKSEFVELKVFNILGSEVSTLVSKKLDQGNHTYTFDGKNLASGIYYYQLVAGDYSEVKKMVLLK